MSPIPGASAVTAALSVAGLPTDRFCFEGFLPAKKAARRTALESLANETRTLIFFESVHRIADALDDMCDGFGDKRAAFIGRELTKMHEQCTQDTLGSLRDSVGNGSIVGKGEFVIVVAGSDAASESSFEVDRLLLELAKRLPVNDAAKVSASVTGLKKNDLYQRILELKDRT